MERTNQLKMFNRFLKENGLYFYYYSYVNHVGFDFQKYINEQTMQNIIISSFNWSKCNNFIEKNINWSRYNSLWYRTYQTYIKI